ncbi:hypothetical protein VYF65_002988 [Lysinibacillus irui]|uniref:hypothetical protein n=1 Tax=Lysinibacillus irui TaxID=2998077 RepID=UPI00388434AC
MNRKYLERFKIDEHLLNSQNWEEVYIEDLNMDEKRLFLQKKEAIDLFLQSNIAIKSIVVRTGIPRSEIYRLLERCLTIKEENTIYGYLGLFKNVRVRSYVTKNYNTNTSGNFTKLLTDHPDLNQLLINEYFNKNKKLVREKKQTVKNIHRKFIEKCRELGLKEEEYPFTSTSMAFKSIERYLKQLVSSHSSLGAKMNGKDALLLAKSVNNTTNAYTELIRPYERVEFDAHQIDAIFSIVTYTPQGDKIVNVMNRLWLLCVIDVASRAIIGYHICYSNKNYSATEVLRCFKNALLPWEPKKLEIPGLQYNEGDGLPSHIIDDTKFALWDEICFDNAKSHQASAVLNPLLELNCSINFGPVATPTRRSIIERFFKTMEFNGFHRIPSTTGSNVLDSKRDKAEEKSIIYEITVNQLEEVMDVVIANYNNTTHSAHYGFTPLEIIRNRIDRGMYIRKLPSHKRTSTSLFTTKQLVKVSGSVSEGRNPFIYYKYERYTSVKLNNDSSMIGEILTIVIDEDNIQTIQAFSRDGLFYDTLTARGAWGNIPHSLNIRLMIMKHKNKAEFDYVKHKDPITAYQNFLATKSITDKKARIKLQEIERYKKEHNIEAQFKKKQVEIQKTQETQNALQQKILKKKDNRVNINETEKEVGLDQTLVIQNEMAANPSDFEPNERHKRIIENSKKKKGESITF